ncbi:MAG: CapA family protein [Actinomycetota bacterium]
MAVAWTIALAALLLVAPPSSATRGDELAPPVVTAPADLVAPVVAAAVAPDGGTWLAAGDGRVFALDGAPFHGSMGAVELVAPVVAIEAAPDGGYWLFAADGGVFAFGDAPFVGSMGGVALNAPIVAAAAALDGRGYWMVASDGGVFAFGSAGFHGALGDVPLVAPIVDVAVSAAGDGYLLLGADGGAFAFGDVAFPGSAAGRLGDSTIAGVGGSAAAPVIVATDGRRWELADGAARSIAAAPLSDRHEVVAVDGEVVVESYVSRRATVSFTGDVLLHGVVQRSAWNGAAYDFGPMLADLEPVNRAADLAICHLEVVISATDDDLSTFPRFRAPRATADGLAGAGFDGCSVASNHSLDWGVGGVATTLDALDAAGLGHTGTARTADEAQRVRLYVVDDIAIAHLSYAYGFNGFRVPADAPWTTNQIDPDRILVDAARARDVGADFVVVSLHWGAEYITRPIGYQREIAEAVLPSPDVDLLVGHHAHVVQPIGRVGEEYVVYGLGNLVSGQVRFGTRDGVAVTVEIHEPRQGELEVGLIAAAPLWTDRPYAVRRAVTGGAFSAAAERTMATLRSEGVDVIEGLLPVP